MVARKEQKCQFPTYLNRTQRNHVFKSSPGLKPVSYQHVHVHDG